MGARPADPVDDLRSPYQRALGARRAALDPRLGDYFSSLGPDQVGVGHGVFTTFGTPRRVLWPLLRLLGRRGVLWPGWATEVPFTVENRLRAGRLHARRTVHLPGGDWTMRDQVLLTPEGELLDVLGSPATIAASLTGKVRDGALHLTSGRVRLRLGPVRVRIPRWCSPQVRLRERAVGAGQEVSLVLEAPVLGRLYEYGGTFTYEIQQERTCTDV